MCNTIEKRRKREKRENITLLLKFETYLAYINYYYIGIKHAKLHRHSIMKFSHLPVSYLACTVWTVAGSMYFEELYSRYMAITGPLLRKLIACLFIVTALPRGSQNLGQGCMHVWYLTRSTCFSINNYRPNRI